MTKSVKNNYLKQTALPLLSYLDQRLSVFGTEPQASSSSGSTLPLSYTPKSLKKHICLRWCFVYAHNPSAEAGGF